MIQTTASGPTVTSAPEHIAPAVLFMPPRDLSTSFTDSPDFQTIKDHLSPRPLLRPARYPLPWKLTQSELSEIAKRHPPPQAWFEEDEECPFVIDEP